MRKMIATMITMIARIIATMSATLIATMRASLSVLLEPPVERIFPTAFASLSAM